MGELVDLSRWKRDRLLRDMVAQAAARGWSSPDYDPLDHGWVVHADGYHHRQSGAVVTKLHDGAALVYNGHYLKFQGTTPIELALWVDTGILA